MTTDTPLVFVATYGPSDAERATVPWIVAATAAASGDDVVVLCTVDASWAATARADDIIDDDLPPLVELRDAAVAAGAEVWLCGACANKRNINEGDLVDGATIVGAAQITDLLRRGKPVSLA